MPNKMSAFGHQGPKFTDYMRDRKAWGDQTLTLQQGPTNPQNPSLGVVFAAQLTRLYFNCTGHKLQGKHSTWEFYGQRFSALSPWRGIRPHHYHHYDILVCLSGTDLLFSNFFLFSLGIDHNPHVLYTHMTYVYFLFLCFILHTITWPREVIIVLWSFQLQSSILQMHPHPHFLLLPPQPHHPYTPHLCQSTTAQLEEGYHPVETYGHPEDPLST